tara:strand:+ start:285 stop:566 length:282 start_codon:yes stop_codon:yes gene_type:complete
MLKKQEDIYEFYFDMFNSKGWKLFIETMLEEKQSMSKSGFYEIKSELELGKLQGAIHYIDTILALENNMKNMYDEAINQQKNKNYVEQIEDGG